MKTTIPEELKRDLPANKWGKLLIVTPVVMTVVATLLAGLASSEMTRAQYDRALGAQLQSKAGDQWNYFQAKKLRGAMQRKSLELLQAIGEVNPKDIFNLPPVPATPVFSVDPSVQLALQAVEKQQTEEEIAGVLKTVADGTLASSLRSAREAMLGFEKATEPLNQALERTEKLLSPGDRTAARDFAASRMRLSGARYDSEARLNQSVANLYELQVRKANLSAERHRRRSSKFFLGMLSAQAAVIMATFAVAAQKRSFLWTVAAIAGIAAIGFAIYVYLQV